MSYASGVAVVVSLCWSLAAAGEGQEAAQPDATAAPAPRSTIREVGGRLQVTGETVDVVADGDEPVASSSLATKTDTPLIETPRSVSVVERQTLDELQAINVSQAHDYVPSFTPQDERGPAYSRGFLVGFYDLRRDGGAPSPGACASSRPSSVPSTCAGSRASSTATAARAASSTSC